MPSSNQNDITTSATKDSQQSHRPLLQTIIQNMTSTGRTSKQTEEYAVGTRPASLEPSADDRRKPNLSFKIVWHNLSYRVDTKKWYTRAKARLFRQQERMTNISEGTTSDTCKIILNNLCGSIMSGQLTAIMGPSGSGKTSLLNCLFQNQTRGVTGSIIVDGARQSKKLKLCFIPQKDYLVEYLTVREDLVFVSKLRNTHIGAFNNQTVQRKTSKTSQDKAGPSSCLIETNEGDECEDETTINKSNKKNNNKDLVRQNKRNSTSNNHVIDHQENAMRIAKLLGLTSCLDVKIGKISGGQQKRLSIAREIMSNPDVLILDEPTTGLDSLSCLKTIRVLKDLAVRPKLDARPMAIVVVIHQPQREVFELFDKVYFISKGGNVIFDEKPQMAENIIENVGHVQMPNANYNPASFLMEIASSEMGEEPINHLNAYQSRKFHSDYDINKLKQLKKQPNRNYAISNWRLCASDDRKFSDIDLVNSDDITLDTKTINNKRESNLIISIHDNEEEYGNNNEQKAEEQEKFIKNSGSNNTNYLADLIDRSTNNDSQQDDNNSTTSSKNSYFISHQLRNCLRSHSTNSVQSFRHVFILTHRSWLSVIRNPSFSTTRLAFHLILPLTMVFIFGSDMGSSNACPMAESELDILDISDKINDKLIERQQEQAKLALENLCFFIVLLYGFSINIISITATHYPLTLRMFKKETMNGLYTSGPYLIAQSLGELPLEMFFPTISVLLAYPLTGQLSSYLEWRMIVTSIIVTLVIYTNHSLGHLCGSIFVSNINVAVIVAQATTLPMILLSGFVVRISRMSYWLRKLSIISPYKLGLDGIMVARYGFEVCQCNTSTFVDSKSVKIARVTTQMRHVMQYLLDRSFEQNSLRDSESIENNFVDSDLSKESNNRTMRINSTIDLHQLNSTYTTSQHSKNMALSYHPTNSDNFIDRMGQNLLKAQTYGLEMSSCQDVKPYPLHIYNLFDSDLFISALGLIVMIVIIKMATFSIVKSYLYFNKA